MNTTLKYFILWKHSFIHFLIFIGTFCHSLTLMGFSFSVMHYGYHTCAWGVGSGVLTPTP